MVEQISVRWPFYKYDVLMPEHIPADIFVWLYLSLFVYINQQAGKSKDSYSSEEKNQVKRLVQEEFPNVIDEITLEKIISYAEKDYVVRDETAIQPEMRKILDEKAFELLESFDDLFSSNLQVKHIYQDAITGEIVPVFEDMPYLQDCTKKEYRRLELLVSKEPSLGKIKAAYKNYLKSLNNIINEYEADDELAFDDPDAEVDFNPFVNEADIIDSAENNISKDPENFNVLFLGSTLLNFKIDLLIENEKIHVSTPFDEQKTLKWMNKCFQKACNVHSELKKLVEENHVQLKGKQQNDISMNNIIYQRNVADQLDVCGALYKLVESVNIPNPDIQDIKRTVDDLKNRLIMIDKYFTAKSDSFFNQIGLYLECLLYPLVDHSDKDKRQSMTEYFFKTQIRTICSKLHLKWDFLMSGKDIFKEWQMSRNHYKADTLNIVVFNTRFLKCASTYYEFIEDAFNLYNLRNQHGHYTKNGNSIDKDFKSEYIEKLYKITKVFLDLY